MTESHPLGPDLFFSLGGSDFRDLLSPDEPAWEILGRLGEAIEERLRPNVGGLPRRGGFVERTAVLHQGAVLLEGFEIRSFGASKGALEVFAEIMMEADEPETWEKARTGLRHGLYKLPERSRKLFVLRYVKKLKGMGLASQTGCNVGS